MYKNPVDAIAFFRTRTSTFQWLMITKKPKKQTNKKGISVSSNHQLSTERDVMAGDNCIWF